MNASLSIEFKRTVCNFWPTGVTHLK